MAYRNTGADRCARFAFAWVLCAAALPACTAEPPLTPTFLGAAVPGGTSAPMQPVVVSGTVLDWTTGAGVPNVTVEMGGVRAVSGAGGVYTLTLPVPGAYDPIVGGLSTGASHIPGRSYRGDFLTNSGTCVSRYGTIANARTAEPVAGADVSLGNKHSLTDATGWYRIDLGCPTTGLAGSNATDMFVTKDGYARWHLIADRGVYLSIRLDLELLPG